MPTPRKVHIPSGIVTSGRKVRAVCSCGHATTPRVDERRALEALGVEHGSTEPTCGLCGRDRGAYGVPEPRRYDHLRITTDPLTGEQFLACRDDETTCRDLSRQQQVHLDRDAFEAFGAEPPRPRLRIVKPRG